MDEDVSLREKLSSIYRVCKFRPTYTLGLVLLSIAAALLEGIGISFILPIVDSATGSRAGGGLMEFFVRSYELLGIPFTLGYIVAGVSVVMIVRYTATFSTAWLRAVLRVDYIRYLRDESFSKSLDVELGYFDQQGSDEILNLIITESRFAGKTILLIVKALQISVISLVYIAIALYLAPWMTVFSIAILGSFIYGIRYFLESGHALGSKLTEANQDIQESVQSGTQGIRDIKMYGMKDKVYSKFNGSLSNFVSAMVQRRKNQAAINNFNQLTAAIAVFVLIYFGVKVADLSIGSLGVYLFAMFQLAPKVSQLNSLVYRAENHIPHLIKSQKFIEDLDERVEKNDGRNPPKKIERIEFDDVSFSYTSEEQVLTDVNFEAKTGEFVAFVGQSGAGKSTIASLIGRMYTPNSGKILCNGEPISEFDLEEWRSRIAYVRQNPYIFNDTLRYNIKAGDFSASDKKIKKVCRISHVTEFMNELPEGLDTQLGEDGVKLSGGQKQRVALARALLKNAEILILDEATSDLDTSIEEKVQREIERIDRKQITITIAHRLSTVKNADRIYTLGDGRVIESGSHDELLEKRGKYAELYSK